MFEYVSLVNNVGTKVLVLVIWLAWYVPFRTWYCSKATRRPESFATRRPRLVLLNSAKASLDGARIVMLLALERDSKMAGLNERKDVRLDN